MVGIKNSRVWLRVCVCVCALRETWKRVHQVRLRRRRWWWLLLVLLLVLL